jgi:hypothetical protein
MRERTRLSTKLQVLRTEQVLAEVRETENRDVAIGAAEGYRRDGILQAQAGDLAAAKMHFEHALAAAPEDWPEAEQVRRDIDAIEAELEGGQE